MKGRAQPSHCDWNPLKRSKDYDNYDHIRWEATIEGTNQPYRLVRIEEFPFHIDCGGECRLYFAEDDIYQCKKCYAHITEEDGEIEWKAKNEQGTKA